MRVCRVVLMLVAGSLLLGGWLAIHPDGSPAHAANPTPAEAVPDEPVQPIPLEAGLDPDRVRLGRQLFHDPRLSGTNTVSCASCHDLNRGGADNQPRSVGADGQHTARNTPTVFNAGLGFRQFWDGRAETLEEQVDGPLTSNHEMGGSWPDVLRKLGQDSAYVEAFRRLYHDQVRPKHVRDALATFERSLTTPNSPFDRFLRGETAALSPSAHRGYELFKSFGCASCHQGRALGGNMEAKFGALIEYYRPDEAQSADPGRFTVTRRPEDRFRFKVPSLRSVVLTAPYFHDGSVPQLEEAVRIMAKHQLAREVTGAEVHSIVAFLRSVSAPVEGTL